MQIKRGTTARRFLVGSLAVLAMSIGIGSAAAATSPREASIQPQELTAVSALPETTTTTVAPLPVPTTTTTVSVSPPTTSTSVTTTTEKPPAKEGNQPLPEKTPDSGPAQNGTSCVQDGCTGPSDVVWFRTFEGKCAATDRYTAEQWGKEIDSTCPE